MTKPAFVVPIVISERLILEPLSFDHAAGMFSMWRQPAVCRFSGVTNDFEGRPIRLPAESSADSDRIIDFFVRHQAEGTGFRWALITRAERRFAGTVGFNSLGRCSEFAYHLSPDFWGRGLMSEASRVALDWLLDHEGFAEADAFIDPRNQASVKLATSLGFRFSGLTIEGDARYVLAVSSG